MINNIARKQTYISKLLEEKLALQLIYQRCKAEGNDIPDFLVKLRLYLQNQDVNPADNAGGSPTGREVAIGYLRGSNLLNNTGQANIVAVNECTAIQIGANRINKQAVAQKAQAPALQIVEPVKQQRSPSSSLQSEKSFKNYYVAEYLKELDLLNNNDLDSTYSKIDKPFDFAIKSNSKHITNLLEWYTDVPVIMKDKEGKTVMVIGNFVYIDNGKPEPMLFLSMSNIQKLQGVSEPNKNQFCIKLHEKTYVISTYSKAPVAKQLSKEEQNQ
ncbi:1798_t:CDS:2, partial [Cetraspora pellucida]